jgi:RNA polymerase sigma-70 factor (sigma-E family)
VNAFVRCGREEQQVNSSTEREYVEFVAHQADRLCRTAYLICGDWKRSEDATQEALLRLYRAWPRLLRKGGLGAYASKAVVSATLDGLRRRSSREVVGGDGYFAAEADPADQVRRVDDRLMIDQALAVLAPRQRACVVLRYFDQLSVDETAEALGCRPGTVKSQTANALNTLRRHLATAGITDFAELGG